MLEQSVETYHTHRRNTSICLTLWYPSWTTESWISRQLSQTEQHSAAIFINTEAIFNTVVDDDSLDELLDELDGYADFDKAQQEVSINVDERRYGKTVTVVSGFDVPQSTLESLASSLKSSLATGGTVNDDAIELQGDHRDRLPELLDDHGYDAI